MGIKIGLLAVRRSIFVAADPDRVWKELESFEAMKRWFGTGHRLLEYEPKVGGSVLLECDVEGVARRFGGAIVVFEPGREVTWDNDWIPSSAPAPNMITLRLNPVSRGTVVELFHHGFERVGPDGPTRHRGFEGGWNLRQLQALRELVEA